MLAIAEKTRCHLQETFLLQMIKNSLVERQWCHSWSIERKMVVSPWIATFRTFGCNLDININHTKLSKTGVWAKTQLYREETLFVSGKKTPLSICWMRHHRDYCATRPINKRFSLELLWETSSMSTQNTGIWISSGDGTVLKTSNGCGWPKYRKLRNIKRE